MKAFFPLGMKTVLETFGWNPFFRTHFEAFGTQGYSAGRVAVQHKGRYLLYTECGELWAQVAGKLRFEASGREDFPAIGDWLVIEARPREGQAVIRAILERKSNISRKVAGKKTEEQILASNVDVLFIVSGLDADFNLSRIERYLSMAWESGAVPVIVLNKADLAENIAERVREVEAVALNAEILVMSATMGQGIAELRNRIRMGKTGVLLGSSGVGKSTLINRLVGYERQMVQDVRKILGRGKHTTTRRELILLPSGGLIIDTPGMREIQPWGGTHGLLESFEDVQELARSCRFRDCQHIDEPGCAIKEAVERGVLESRRFQNYQKLERELRYLCLKQNQTAALLEKRKKIAKVFNRSLKKRI